MTAVRVGIVDYRMGNLRSVEWALQHLGAAVSWVHGPADLEGIDLVVLPGVGAFATGMRELDSMGLVAPLRRWAERGRSFLGICLGFQLLFEGSEEGEGAAGLGLLPGTVRKLPGTAGGQRLKVPQMGWNDVRLGGEAAGHPFAPWDGTYFYFVHSFVAPETVPAPHLVTEYGVPFVSGVQDGSLWGFQFHPERSGGDGLALLRRVLEGVAV